jgi:hypothetical protein
VELKVGDVLWCYDYRSNSKPWFDKTITGETKQSWVIGEVWSTHKVLKKDLTENQGAYGRRQWFTSEGRDNYLWIHNHAPRMAEAVRTITDIELLKQIAELIGYNEATK